ncbi:response regulator, partial [Facklamia hominis]
MSLILAVDDELDMLDLIKNILKKNDHQVDAYQNPLDIDNSKLSKYDLILLDVMMPGIDG